jgi:hypothetical protein
LSKSDVAIPQTLIDGTDLQNILARWHDRQMMAFSFLNQVSLSLLGESEICPN